MKANSLKAMNRQKATAKREQACILIRNALAETGLYRWQLADLLGVSPETVTRMLRHDMPEQEQAKIVEMIREYSEGVTHE